MLMRRSLRLMISIPNKSSLIRNQSNSSSCLRSFSKSKKSHPSQQSSSKKSINNQNESIIKENNSTTNNQIENNKNNSEPNIVHQPVLVEGVLKSLGIMETHKKPFLILDTTFGDGGHTEMILKGNEKSVVIATDRDSACIPRMNFLKQKYGDRFFHKLSKFSDIQKTIFTDKQLVSQLLKSINLEENNVSNLVFDGILADLGVSSRQLDEKERGFSFQKEGPLLMTMGEPSSSSFDDFISQDQDENSKEILTAEQVINKYSVNELADIIHFYGEEVKAKQVAKAIVSRRSQKPFKDTLDFAQVVRSQLYFNQQTRTDPVTKTFQAIRMFVNDELKELKSLLSFSESYLRAPDGKLAVISFHSLEDRIVKQFFSLTSKADIDTDSEQPQQPSFVSLKYKTSYVYLAEKEEVSKNPRSRSAKLRSGIRTQHPPFSHSVLFPSGE